MPACHWFKLCSFRKKLNSSLVNEKTWLEEKIPLKIINQVSILTKHVHTQHNVMVT